MGKGEQNVYILTQTLKFFILSLLQTSPEDLVTFFNQFGEVKYVRMTCPENDVIKTALVEFTDQSTMVKALQKNGTTYKGNAIGIAHSTIAILKPKFRKFVI